MEEWSLFAGYGSQGKRENWILINPSSSFQDYGSQGSLLFSFPKKQIDVKLDVVMSEISDKFKLTMFHYKLQSSVGIIILQDGSKQKVLYSQCGSFQSSQSIRQHLAN